MKRKLFAIASTLFWSVVLPILLVWSFFTSPTFAALFFVATLLSIVFKRGWTFMFMVNREQPSFYFDSGKGRLSSPSAMLKAFFPVRIGLGVFSIAIYQTDVEVYLNYVQASNLELAEFKMQHLPAVTPKRGSIAVCSSGFVGLITNDNRQEITYKDGSTSFAYVGIQLFNDTNPVEMRDKNGKPRVGVVRTKAGKPWSSRSPRIIGEVNLGLLPYANGLGVGGWNAIYKDTE